jgi:hypothetical protein
MTSFKIDLNELTPIQLAQLYVIMEIGHSTPQELAQVRHVGFINCGTDFQAYIDEQRKAQ